MTDTPPSPPNDAEAVPSNAVPSNAVPNNAVPNNSARWRLLVLVIAALALFAISHHMGWLDDKRATMERLRVTVQGAGPWGFALFVAIFIAGELVHIPGIIFFATGIFVWGSFWGALAGYIGSMSACVSIFFIVRKVGGNAFAGIKNKFVQRVLGRLESHPIRVILALRTVLWNPPPLNYAFALSKVGFRDYFIGSALGLVIPVVIQAVFLERVLAFVLG